MREAPKRGRADSPAGSAYNGARRCPICRASPIVARILVIALLGCGVAACGKIPESGEAKKIGNIPKQTIDKALQQGAQRTRDADDKTDQKP